MGMKWHPIENGIMNGVPRDEELIFTVLDEDTGEVRTAAGKVDEYFLKKYRYVFVGRPGYPVDSITLKAWMKLPEPYKPTPDKCFKCNHGHLQHEEDSDNWFECELLQRAVPPCDKPEDCPLNRELHVE